MGGMQAPHRRDLPDADPADGMHIQHSEDPGSDAANKFAEQNGLFPISYYHAASVGYVISGLSPDGELVKMQAPHRRDLPDADPADGMHIQHSEDPVIEAANKFAEQNGIFPISYYHAAGG